MTAEYPTCSYVRALQQLQLIGVPASAAQLRQHVHQTLDPQGQIEAPVSGYLGCEDTYYAATLKRVGRVYEYSGRPLQPGDRARVAPRRETYPRLLPCLAQSLRGCRARRTRIPHEFRRTGAPNLLRAGVPDTSGML